MRLSKKRRIEGKTDYKKRIGLLKSNKPRIVFRKTNQYIIAQYIISEEAQDSVKIGLTSKDLIKYSWPKEMQGSLKSIPATYLTGYLMGKNILKNKMDIPVVDFGMLRTIHKNKLFAFLKGLIDSGVKISCQEEAFPEQERIMGKNLKNDFSKTFEIIKSKIDKE
jgi:large subunit ribosomal protein L18